MPTVDLSNLIRRAVAVIIKRLGSPFALLVIFAAGISALATSVISQFDIIPEININLHAVFDTNLPFVDLGLYIVNVDLFLTVLDWFISFINTMLIFIPSFSLTFFTLSITYRYSSAMRKEIQDTLVG